jgi:hypothetical protein
MLKRLKYVSRCSADLTLSEVESIVEHARKNNPGRGITGVLMTAGGVFFQVLEGPAEEVDALYAKIRKDPRHDDVLLLDSVTGLADRLFPNWSLKRIDLGSETDLRLESLRALVTVVADQRKSLDKLIGALERAIWFEFVTELESDAGGAPSAWSEGPLAQAV